MTRLISVLSRENWFIFLDEMQDLDMVRLEDGKVKIL